MDVRLYEPDDANQWDTFCTAAPQATILHCRRFLSYHGDRFQDRSLIVQEGSEWLAQFPAAVQPGDDATVCSHPGASYGGLLTAPSLNGERVIEILAAIADHYRDQGYQRLRYKAVPHIYHSIPMQDDLYALYRLGANRYRCDLTATLNLHKRGIVSSRRKRGYKKAVAAGVRVEAGAHLAPAIWKILEERLPLKHGVRPVHSLAEIQALSDRFPDEIQFIAALLGDEVVAAVVLFESESVSHSQYTTSSEAGNAVGALDLVFEYVIDRAARAGKRYFDFGNSNEDQGRRLNQSLNQFKREFGSGGVVNEFYELDLTRPIPESRNEAA